MTKKVPELVTSEFLEAIIPQGFHRCLSLCRPYPDPGRPPVGWKDRFFGPKANGAMTQWLDSHMAHQDTNLYFGLAGYNNQNRRLANNAEEIQCLIIDLDIRPSKPDHFHHRNQIPPALAALKKAVPELPTAMLVESGRGWHVYYVFDRSVKITQWKPLSTMLIRIARVIEPRLMSDPKSTSDAARVLRLPGSTNAKTEGERFPCYVMRKGGTASPSDIKDGFARAAVAMNISMTEDLVSGELFPGAAVLPDYMQGIQNTEQLGKGMGNLGERFHDLDPRPILAGCNQMKVMASDFGNVDEPMWMLMLRVLLTCSHGEDLCHVLSKGEHGRYSKGGTNFKITHIRNNFETAGVGCKEFEEMNPQGCRGCPHKNDIYNPCQLALRQAEVRGHEDSVQEARVAAAAGTVTAKGFIPQPSYAKQSRVQQGKGTPVTSLPVLEGKKGNRVTKPVFNAHIHLEGASDHVRSMMRRDAERMSTAERNVHFTITHGTRNFPVVITAGALSDTYLKATEALRTMGVVFEPGKNEQMAVGNYLNELNRLSSNNLGYYRSEKGWRKGGNLGEWLFVAGARTYRPSGKYEDNLTAAEHHGKGSDSLGFMERACTGRPVGSLVHWQRAMEMYNGPKMQAAQLLLLSGLSNTLLPLLSDDKGGLLLSLTGESGNGKTTLLHFQSSFAGNYTRNVIPGRSTTNALGAIMSEANCLMLNVDDSVSQRADLFSELLAMVTGGSDKSRGTWDSKAGMGVSYTEGFNASLLLTSNFSTSAVIGTGGKGADQLDTEAARTRTLEIPAHLMDVKHSTDDQWARSKRLISKNHGHAAHAFFQYVVENQTAVHNMLYSKEHELRHSLGQFSHPDKLGQVRFWARWLAVSGVTAYIVLQKLNLLPWNHLSIMNTGIELAKDATHAAKADDESLIELFWNTLQAEDGRDVSTVNRITREMPVKRRAHWATASRTSRRAQSQWKLKTLQQSTDKTPHTVLAEVIDIMESKHVAVERERTVYMQISVLRGWVKQHQGEALPVASWSDLYRRLRNAGCFINGVQENNPDRGAHTQNTIQVDLNERSGSASHHRVRVVEIRLPPIKLYR